MTLAPLRIKVASGTIAETVKDARRSLEMLGRRRYYYRVKALRKSVDGDTWDLTLVESEPPRDFGFTFILPSPEFTPRCRIIGIDVVEKYTTLGPGARDFAEGWIRLAVSDDVLEGESFMHDTTTPDASFGRWLIDLWRIDTGARLVDALRTAGFEKVKP
jgi:hypothetical protein